MARTRNTSKGPIPGAISVGGIGSGVEGDNKAWYRSGTGGETIASMNTSESLMEMVDRVVSTTARRLSAGENAMKNAWSIAWKLYRGSAADADEKQLLARCAASKREHYEQVHLSKSEALRQFAEGVVGDKRDSFCLHLYELQIDDDDRVVSRREVDSRAGCCM